MRYVRHLTTDELELVNLYTIWCAEVMHLAPATCKLYRTQVSKILVLELRYDVLDVNERTAWHRFEEFVAWSMND